MAATTEDGPSFSTFLGQFLGRLYSPNLVDRMLLQRLETSLHCLQALLPDAEHKQIQNPAVKRWLDYLKDAVRSADDLLNRVSTRSEAQDEVSNLESIIDRLESRLEHKDYFDLKEISRENLSGRTPTPSLVEGYKIYGRDQDKEAIFKLLLEDNTDAHISVIPIVGVGGIGKTTLAQYVYNDDYLKQNFDLKAWVYVEEFDIVEIIKKILEAVTSSNCNIDDFNTLRLHLKEKLSGKKFLFVLDNIWNEDAFAWNLLVSSTFIHGMKGSKILLTTRSEEVASIVQTGPAFFTDCLSDEDCLSIIANCASPSTKFSENLIQQKLAGEIVRKCQGLPLAVELLGGLLRTKYNFSDWDIILKSDIWELDEDRPIHPALLICYNYLPAHLKRCFASCSSYPKFFKFNKDDLITFWIAKGLLQSYHGEKTLEEVGHEYFDDLVARSFLQHFSLDSSRTSFVMHDLLHDLAMSKANELRTFLPLDFTEDISLRIPSPSSRGTLSIQILPFPPLTLPTSSSRSILQHQWMISIRIRKLRIRLELWRLMGLLSSVVGLLCQALSPSFTRLIGGWDTFKFFLYGVLVSIISIITMSAKKCTLSRHGKLKAHVGFAVLMLTSLYSFCYEKATNGKPDLLSMIANGAFALMSLSLSRVLKLGFEVGLFAFFLGSFVIQLVTIKLVLIPIAIIYGLPLYVIHSYSSADSDYLPSVMILDE